MGLKLKTAKEPFRCDYCGQTFGVGSKQVRFPTKEEFCLMCGEAAVKEDIIDLQALLVDIQYNRKPNNGEV